MKLIRFYGQPNIEKCRNRFAKDVQNNGGRMNKKNENSVNIVTEEDGIPVLYPECVRGFGVRVVNPQNPKAPSKDLSANIVYIAPGGILEPHRHENEEVYIIVEGNGIGYFGLEQPVEISKDMFLHFPSNAIHGIKNTSGSMMKIVTVNSPPVRHIPEWKTNS